MDTGSHMAEMAERQIEAGIQKMAALHDALIDYFCCELHSDECGEGKRFKYYTREQAVDRYHNGEPETRHEAIQDHTFRNRVQKYASGAMDVMQKTL